jgi:hypothetical protein
MQRKYLARIEELIGAGESLLKTVRRVPGRVRLSDLATGEVLARERDQILVDWSPLVEWRTNCVATATQLVPTHHALHGTVAHFNDMNQGKSNVEWGIATLRSLKENLERGFLGDFLLQVEAELAADYMGQAEALLAEGQSGKFDHVPAAVLAGAVLEKHLRSLCQRQSPALPTTTDKGEPKKLNVLIDDLKKAGVYNENKAKQLRAWAGTRNHAAHGEFGEFTRTDVEQMVAGINTFLAEFGG